MERAARWPSATAVMMIRGPKARSPPAKTSGRDVASVSGSTCRFPRGVSFKASAGRSQERSAAWPTASTTVSQATTASLPSINWGLKRRFSSKTLLARTNWMPLTRPFSPMIFFGPQRVCRRMPSFSASSISSRAAGISSRFSRQYMCTSGAPLRMASRATSSASRTSSGGSPSRWVSSSRAAVAECRAARSSGSLMPADCSAWRTTERATSKATLPPPMTTTLRPSST